MLPRPEVAPPRLVLLQSSPPSRLKEEANRRRLPFREVVNAALRRALGSPGGKKKKRPMLRTYASRLRSGFDPAGFNKLADELDDEATAATLRRPR